MHSALPAHSSFEKAFSYLLSDLATIGNPRLRLFAQGTSAALNPAIQEPLFLIGREAILNAFRHSEATTIEVEIQYRRDVLRMLVRDNGAGIGPAAVQQSDSHRGLRVMRARAEEIGARIEIWSGKGSGTEVSVAVPLNTPIREPQRQPLGSVGLRP